MRKYIINFLFVSVMMLMSVTEMWSQNTFRIYKHDGSMNVFFYTQLDSITFSNTDESGLMQDFVATQNFHTSDSIYKIPVNDIDSVAFTPIPTIYKTNARRIEGTLRDYVEGSDSLTLIVKKTIPTSLLPKIGENLVTLECDEVLPYGFIGKVEKITYGDTYINVECSKTSLTDIFESLGLEGTASSDNSRKGLHAPANPNFHSFEIPTVRRELSFANEIDAGAGFSGTYDMTSFLEFSTDKCDVLWTFIITPLPFQLPQVYYSLTYTAQNTLTIGSSLSSSDKWEKKIPLESFRNIRIPGVPQFELLEEGGFFIGIEGKIGLDGSFSKPFTTVLHFSHDNKAPAVIAPTFKIIGRDATSKTTIEGEAAISLGLYGKFGIAPLVKELANVGAGFEVGATFSSSLSLMPGVTPIETPNTEMYDEMNRDDFFKGDFTLAGEVSAEIANNTVLKGELDFGDFLFKNPFFTRGIVPLFNNVTLKEADKAGVLTANASMSRKLMFDTPVGFALYDDNKELVEKWWSPTNYKDKEGQTITYDFKGLSVNKEYTLHPITRAFKDNMVANPSSKAKIFPDVKTKGTSDITKNSATLSGLFEEVSGIDNYSCGFYYGTDPTLGMQNGTFVTATSLNSDGTFYATIKNLKAKTKYYYRACVIIDNKTILADNILSFTTMKENDGIVDIDFSVAYPAWYDYIRINHPRPNDGIYFSVAVQPNIPESEDSSIISYGPVIYKDGKEVDYYICSRDKQFLIDGWVDCSHYVNRNELKINNAEYKAVAPSSYKVGVLFKKITESGDTITVESKERKQLEWVYDEKPWICIYKCSGYSRDNYIGGACNENGEINPGCVSHDPYSPERFDFNLNYYYATGGGFWMEQHIENYSEFPINGLYYCFPIDNYDLGAYESRNYSIDNIPIGLTAGWIDVNGKTVSANIVPFGHDSQGMISVDFKDISPLEDRIGVEKMWPSIYKNTKSIQKKSNAPLLDKDIEYDKATKKYILQPSKSCQNVSLFKKNGINKFQR